MPGHPQKSNRPAKPPVGLVTFLFTDIEGSTRLWELAPGAMERALNKHDSILEAIVSKQGGYLFKKLGDGIVAAFEDPQRAVQAAFESQMALQSSVKIGREPLRARMAVYTGLARFRKGDYMGRALNRASRLNACGHGGQILVGSSSASILDQNPQWQLRHLGEYRLRGIDVPEHVFQLCANGLATEFPPLRPSSGSPVALIKHNLEEDDRPFVGRVAERERIAVSLADPSVRLLSVTGLGGIGKTRLARQIIRDLCETFPDGAWFVECDAISSREGLARAVGVALDIAESGPDAEWELLRGVRARRALLVLDCFEHHLSDVPLVERLLKEAPGLKCLVTSRVVLGSTREFEIPLAPFAVEGTGARTADCLQLFENAAKHAKPGFKLSNANRNAALEICRNLEGVPLAVVLAAARLRHMSLHELKEEVVRGRLEVLRRPDGSSDRHGDLRQVIAQSVALLSDDDRRLLGRLAVFVGGFSLEDARSVMSDVPGLLDGLARLRDHGLLQIQEIQGKSRYRILDSIRDYLATFEAESGAQIRESDLERHASHFAQLASGIHSMVGKEKWRKGSDALWRDLGNYRLAAATATEQALHETVAQLATALCRLYFEAGLWKEFSPLADAAITASTALACPKLEADMLGLKGALARRMGKEQEASRLWRRRLALAEKSKDLWTVADAWFDLGLQAHESGDYQEAGDLFASSLNVAQSLPGHPLLPAIHSLTAEIASRFGEEERARSEAEAALALLRRSGPKKPSLIVFRALSHAFLELGQLDRAEAAAKQMISLALEGDRTIAAGWGLLDLAEVQARRNASDKAHATLMAAQRIPAQRGSRFKKHAARALLSFENEERPDGSEAWVEAQKERTWRELVASLAEGQRLLEMA